MCDDSRCFYHDDKELFHRVRSTWTESPNTLDWEFCVLKLGALCTKTGSLMYYRRESEYAGLGVRRLRTPIRYPHGLLLYALQ